MMSWLPKLFWAALIAVFLQGAALAGETPLAKEAAKESAQKSPSKKKPAKAKKPRVQKFVGNVAAVDSKNGALSVKGSEATKNFTTPESAKETLERLAVGDRVRLQYSEKDGKLQATMVRRVKLPQTKKKSATPGAKAKATDKPTKVAVK